MKKIILIGTLVLILTVVGFSVWKYKSFWMPSVSVSNFEECIAQGYPVLESYPRQCKTPDGKTFVEDIGIETIKIKAYFNNDGMDPEFSCNKVFPVEREVPKTQVPKSPQATGIPVEDLGTVAGAALEELLKGPTDAEKEQGFFTSINPDVKIQKLSIEDEIAKVDFDEQLEFQVGGSCRVAAIRAQITETLKQFPTVKDVIISIDGRTEDILQP